MAIKIKEAKNPKSSQSQRVPKVYYGYEDCEKDESFSCCVFCSANDRTDLNEWRKTINKMANKRSQPNTNIRIHFYFMFCVDCRGKCGNIEFFM